MSLADLLRVLGKRGLQIHVTDERAFVRGGTLTAELREAVGEHKEHLVRLHRPRQASWRQKLLRADPDTQEVWALLAHGYQQAGDPAAVAEFLAWHDVAP